MNVVAYLRCSTTDQADSRAGIEAQRDALTADAARRGWHIVEWIEDAGHSATSMRRPGLIRALAMLGSGEADALAVSKVDRLSRSMRDYVGLIERARREGWLLVALDAPVDSATPTGEAMLHMIVAFSQLERRLIGQRTKDALAVKRQQGVRLGRPRTMPDEVVRRIKAAHEAGKSFAQIARTLTAEGVATAQGGVRWYAATVRKVVLA